MKEVIPAVRQCDTPFKIAMKFSFKKIIIQ